MATISINVPDAELGRVTDAFARAYGWRSVALDGNKAAFAKAALVGHIKATVRGIERADAEAAALAAVSVSAVNPS